ncbi:cerebellin-1-like isoform X1 [Crassostrea angulata]|uniref:cerebellin-1-like isoform X1 n=1 Tax=Magallana angulata TaxID=2784310 RepID=UPI0022B0F588|nr:cerebellin-1-like isoform X1 [Crassostrea angulata]
MSFLYASMFAKLYGAVLLFSLLFGVSGSDDFITKYDKYNSVCRRMGYQDKGCEETDHLRPRDSLQEVIAFHARMSTDQKNIKNRNVVVFGTVTLNTGKAYNPTASKFTAPSRGHYSFTWTIATYPGAMFNTQLVINGKSVSYNHVNGRVGGNNYEAGSSTVILKMEKNDVVSILSADTGESARGLWSSFSGFKL